MMRTTMVHLNANNPQPARQMTPRFDRVAAKAHALATSGLLSLLLLLLCRPAIAQVFVGSDSCAGCHRSQYADWQRSDHWHAMQPATAETVLGNFADATFRYFGRTTRFTRRDAGFFVTTDNARGEAEEFRIAYTFGHYPLQQYLIEFPDGRLQALSISWDSRPAAAGGQRWFHLYPDENVDAADPLHWTGAFQNWNSRCAACHTTDLKRNYDMATDSYATRWAESTVGCEACHGPAHQHVRWANGDRAVADRGFPRSLRKLRQPVAGVLPTAPVGDGSVGTQLQVCGNCHARRGELQQTDPAAGFFDNYTLSPLIDVLYHADGQINDEVYELGSFLQSKMHRHQVTCSNCHDPHSNRTRISGNGLCLQCHAAAKYDNRAHSLHEPNSAGSQCIDCHMATKTYMGVDVRRDHSFRIPDPIASLRLGTPNACNQCHTDRDAAWAAAIISKRTGRTDPIYPHAAVLTAARRNDATAMFGLGALARDSNQAPIIRAIAVSESARFPSLAQLGLISSAVAAADPLLRESAAAAARAVPAESRLEYLRPLLTDKVKSVRIAAARQLGEVPITMIPAAAQAAVRKLFTEYERSLRDNADLPEAMSELGMFLAAQGDLIAAEAALRHARRLAPRYLPALLNLADVLRARNRDDLGEKLLLEARAAYPENGDVPHALGLLYVRTDRTEAAVALLQRASELAPDNAQYAFVHAVALAETGNRAAAIALLDRARQRFPNDGQIRDALNAYRAAR
ncbi:MAG: tetratricopeptide repeat protein [Gammaproteobacteria bacterium]|nr:tetratricopeptide repeat protein [Gammaproteobacteria bacterium]